jgi:hypothetical protein
MQQGEGLMARDGGTASQGGQQTSGSAGKVYLRFGAMIATATVVMYVLTYTNVVAIEHVHLSEERLYMALVMGAAMTIIMLGYMRGMYRDAWANVLIVVGALVVGVTAFLLSQTQVLVDDVDYMRGMIPHHSIAILTSERAGIQDVRVRQLADGIIRAQVREIAEMEWLISDIEANGLATTESEAQGRPVPSFGATR